MLTNESASFMTMHRVCGSTATRPREVESFLDGSGDLRVMNPWYVLDPDNHHHHHPRKVPPYFECAIGQLSQQQ